MRTLLVTGFGPFPSMPRNPSGRLAERVAASPRWRLLAIAPRCRVLTTAYGALATELAPALAERPDAVLMIGVAGRADRVRVEWRATARRSRLVPDADGSVPGRQGSGDARRTRAAPDTLLRILRGHGVPSRLSRDAGRYLCNASYFRALAEPAPTLFIHVPKAADPAHRSRSPRRPCRQSGADALAAALVDVAAALLRQARVERRRTLL